MNQVSTKIVRTALLVCFLCAVGLCSLALIIAGVVTLPRGFQSLSAQADLLPYWSWSAVPKQLALTLGWIGAITLTAALIGIPAGHALARWHRTGSVVAWISTFAILCWPPHMLFWIWGLAITPDTFLGHWASHSPQRATALQIVQLWWGLTWWTWPIIALPVAAALRRIDARIFEGMAMDGASDWRIVFHALRLVRAHVAVGVGLAMLFNLTSFAAFDLAATSLPIADTFDSVLRRIRFELGPDAALAAALPLIVLHGTLASALLVIVRSARRVSESVHRPRKTSAGSIGYMTLILSVSLLVPIMILLSSLSGWTPLVQLVPLEGQAMMQSFLWSLLAGLLCAMLTWALTLAWMSGNKTIVMLGTAAAIGVVLLALLPASTRGSMVLSLWVHASQLTDALTGSRLQTLTNLGNPTGTHLSFAWPVILGYFVTFGFIAVFMALAIVRTEPAALRDLRQLDGATSGGALIAAVRGRALAPAIGVGLLTAALALGEVSTTMIVLPPGAWSLTQRLLNKMHYAYEDSAIATCLMLLLIIFIMAAIAFVLFRILSLKRLPAQLTMTVCMAAMLISVPGCNESNSASSKTSANVFTVVGQIGSVGRAPGQFVYPRACDFDVANDRLYVIDRTGRIQRFGSNFVHELSINLPDTENGYPTGITVEQTTGRIFVADTHQHRVLIFSPDGKVISSFGSYGTEPGQFIYPTDVGLGPDGTIYVSEFGGNDRIQAFSAEGNYLFEFGGPGHGQGAFSRPQSIKYNPRRDELIIADACNHRIVITDPQGNWIETIGRAGSAPGEFSYPYDFVLMDDDSMLVTEFGTGRLQWINRDGSTRSEFGQRGNGPGEFVNPWGITTDERHIFVVDGSNNRITVLQPE